MRSISIAEAKNGLPKLVHQAEAGAAIHITRHGKPVAVLLSEQDYQRWLAQQPQPNFAEAIATLRAEADFEPVEVDTESLRPSGPGRPFDW